MKIQQQKLLIQQIDRKFHSVEVLKQMNQPDKGWINAIRTALKMSLRQLGNRMGISAQSETFSAPNQYFSRCALLEEVLI